MPNKSSPAARSFPRSIYSRSTPTILLCLVMLVACTIQSSSANEVWLTPSDFGTVWDGNCSAICAELTPCALLPDVKVTNEENVPCNLYITEGTWLHEFHFENTQPSITTLVFNVSGAVSHNISLVFSLNAEFIATSVDQNAIAQLTDAVWDVTLKGLGPALVTHLNFANSRLSFTSTAEGATVGLSIANVIATTASTQPFVSWNVTESSSVFSVTDSHIVSTGPIETFSLQKVSSSVFTNVVYDGLHVYQNEAPEEGSGLERIHLPYTNSTVSLTNAILTDSSVSFSNNHASVVNTQLSMQIADSRFQISSLPTGTYPDVILDNVQSTASSEAFGFLLGGDHLNISSNQVVVDRLTLIDTSSSQVQNLTVTELIACSSPVPTVAPVLTFNGVESVVGLRSIQVQGVHLAFETAHFLHFQPSVETVTITFDTHASLSGFPSYIGIDWNDALVGKAPELGTNYTLFSAALANPAPHIGVYPSTQWGFTSTYSFEVEVESSGMVVFRLVEQAPVAVPVAIPHEAPVHLTPHEEPVEPTPHTTPIAHPEPVHVPIEHIPEGSMPVEHPIDPPQPTPSTPSNPPTHPPSKKKTSAGVIAGAVLGTIAGIGLIVAIVLIYKFACNKPSNGYNERQSLLG